MWKTADPSYPPDVDPSELRHQITWLNESTAMGASGVEPSWAPSSPPVISWASIEEPRGQTVIQNGQDTTQVDVIVKIRFRAGVAASQRFQDSSGNIYRILSITKPKGMDVLLALPCLLIGTNQ